MRVQEIVVLPGVAPAPAGETVTPSTPVTARADANVPVRHARPPTSTRLPIGFKGGSAYVKTIVVRFYR